MTSRSGDATVTTQLIAVTAGRHDVPGLADFRLGLHLGPAVTADCRCDGQRLRHRQADGDLLFVPPGLPGIWQDDADCRFLRISLAPGIMSEAAGSLGLDARRLTASCFGLAPRLHFRDAAIEHMARSLLALHPTTDPGAEPDRQATSRPMIAALGQALALRLILTSNVKLPGASVPAKTVRGLSKPQRRQLEGYIEAHLDRPMPLADLAAQLDIGVSSLTALFRATYGLSPHQYVLQKRLDRAERLLRTGDLPVSAVALMAGFAHQSHLSNLMRRHRGSSPQQFRRRYLGLA